tara:strand:+ start:113 stop:454 length:342 start_codon:yes stop_codon:yes gene_type:complete
MKPIIKENSPIPGLLSWFIQIEAITLYPYIISRGEMDEKTLNHESIHIRQQEELVIVGFYILYVGYWLKNKFINKMDNSQAYLNIPFEREAYLNEHDPDYLGVRKKMAWRKYK